LAIVLASAAVPIALWVAYLYLSFWGIQDCGGGSAGATCHDNTPDWLVSITRAVPLAGGATSIAYIIVAAVLLILGILLNPNANSLHRLYRDRLSKAFLFDPSVRQESTLFEPRGRLGEEPDPSLRNADLKPLDQLKLSDLKAELAPYHLINAALNIEA